MAASAAMGDADTAGTRMCDVTAAAATTTVGGALALDNDGGDIDGVAKAQGCSGSWFGSGELVDTERPLSNRISRSVFVLLVGAFRNKSNKSMPSSASIKATSTPSPP